MGSSQALLETAFSTFNREHVSMSSMPGLAVLLGACCLHDWWYSLFKSQSTANKETQPQVIPSVEDIKSPRALVVGGWKGDGWDWKGAPTFLSLTCSAPWLQCLDSQPRVCQGKSPTCPLDLVHSLLWPSESHTKIYLFGLDSSFPLATKCHFTQDSSTIQELKQLTLHFLYNKNNKY